MPSKEIFCNSPWYELQIYWDGSYSFCCAEDHKPYPEDQSHIYNVRNMSIRSWFDSEPMRQARSMMFGQTHNSACKNCYVEEDNSASSRRHRCNQKSVIFTRGNFFESYLQSPHYPKFDHSNNHQGAYDGMPVDLHIDLGNYCNLTCKMCVPEASSSIAVQYVKWGIESAKQYVGTDWTRDSVVWNRVLDELLEIPNLKNIHFMGGETLITPKFEEFVDFMLAHRRTDLHFSFVTNGTKFNAGLMKKLTQFKRVGIEVSIESTTKHNAYQRQGTDTDMVLQNIEKYIALSNNNITVTIRPAIGLLTIGYYHTLLRYCLEKKLLIKGLIVYDPSYFEIKLLPENIKQQYQLKYQELIKEFALDQENIYADYNESDPHQVKRVIANQAIQCINLLSTPAPADSETQLNDMVAWCRRWDQVHKYNALELYPELADIFVKHGYTQA